MNRLDHLTQRREDAKGEKGRKLENRKVSRGLTLPLCVLSVLCGETVLSTFFAPSRLRAFAFLFFATALLLLPGCGTSKLSGGGGRVEQLYLLGTPVAIDVDNRPGPDGLGVRVYASNPKAPEAVRIASGAIEVMVYDGTVPSIARSGTNAVPLVTVSYTAQQLRKYEYKTAVGTSYNFVPVWGDRKPTKNRVTVVARYTAEDGRIVRSGPITVPMAVK